MLIKDKNKLHTKQLRLSHYINKTPQPKHNKQSTLTKNTTLHPHIKQTKKQLIKFNQFTHIALKITIHISQPNKKF